MISSEIDINTNMASLDKIKVAVRVRPFNKREIAMGTAHSVVRMVGSQTLLHHPDGEDLNKIPKTFTFDNCFDSLDSGKLSLSRH